MIGLLSSNREDLNTLLDADPFIDSYYPSLFSLTVPGALGLVKVRLAVGSLNPLRIVAKSRSVIYLGAVLFVSKFGIRFHLQPLVTADNSL